jgi:hypothetical protein
MVKPPLRTKSIGRWPRFTPLLWALTWDRHTLTPHPRPARALATYRPRPALYCATAMRPGLRSFGVKTESRFVKECGPSPAVSRNG